MDTGAKKVAFLLVVGIPPRPPPPDSLSLPISLSAFLHISVSISRCKMFLMAHHEKTAVYLHVIRRPEIPTRLLSPSATSDSPHSSWQLMNKSVPKDGDGRSAVLEALEERELEIARESYQAAFDEISLPIETVRLAGRAKIKQLCCAVLWCSG